MLTQAPAVDSKFVPNDVDPKDDDVIVPAGDMSNSVSRSVEKSVQKSVQKATSTATATITRESIARAIGDVDVGRISMQALQRLGLKVVSGKLENGVVVPDDRPMLLANVLLNDADANLRRTAAWGLSEYAENDLAVKALSTALLRDKDSSVREMAAWALGNGDDRSSMSLNALSSALHSDADERVRVTATWALGNLGADEAVDILSAATMDKNRDIRTRAIWAIGNISPREAPKVLLQSLRDPDPKIRELSAWALYQIEDPSAAPALNAALQAESSKELQITYIRALAALGEKSVDAIRGLLTSSDPKIKAMAVRALAGGNAAGPWPWPWPQPRPYP
jgi:HEAT repeat protein